MFNYKNLIIPIFTLLLSGCGDYASHTPPEADAGADRTLYAGEVTLDASGSKDDDNNIIHYTWSENNETIGDEKVITLSSLSVGTHHFTLEVEDADGNKDRDAVAITILENIISLSDKVTESSSTTIDAYNPNIQSYKWIDEDGKVVSTSSRLYINNLFIGEPRTLTLEATGKEGVSESKTITLTKSFDISIISSREVTNSIIFHDEVDFDLSINGYNYWGSMIVGWYEDEELLSTSRSFSKTDFSIGEHIIDLSVSINEVEIKATESFTVEYNLNANKTSSDISINTPMTLNAEFLDIDK